MAGGESPSERPDESAVHRQAADELLERGRYEQLAEILRQADVACQEADDAPWTHVLAAARRICEACRQIRAEVDWHRQAREAAARRERELRDQLRSLLDLIDTGGPPATPPGLALPLERSRRQGLWQRIQAFFTPSSRRRLSSGEPAPLPARTEAGEAAPPSGTAGWPAPTGPQERAAIERPAAGGTGVPGASIASVVDTPAVNAAGAPPGLAMPSAESGLGVPEDSTGEAEGDRESPDGNGGQPGQADTTESPGAEAPAALLAVPEREAAIVSPVGPAETEREEQTLPSLVVYCLGPFRVYQNDELITDWTGLKGQCILKYLVAHRGRPTAKDILMDVLWPEAEPEAARRNLHQAVYCLRQTLRQRQPDFQHVQFENDCYLLNPEMNTWLDFEEFEKHVQASRRLQGAGQLAEAMAEYGIAEGLYHGDFLAEDVYQDWPSVQRGHIRNMYLDIASGLSEYFMQQGEYTAAMALCQKVLARDNCHEEAHRRLMRCYQGQGQRHLAVRQYQTCVQALEEELDLAPSEQTVALYRRITRA